MNWSSKAAVWRHTVTRQRKDPKVSKLAKTPAQRQAQYRKVHFQGSLPKSARVSMAIPFFCKRKLEILADHHGLTLRAMLVRAIDLAEKVALDEMSPDETAYYYCNYAG